MNRDVNAGADEIANLHRSLQSGLGIGDAVRRELGGRTMALGLIRFHSSSQYLDPSRERSWPAAWGSLLASQPDFVGEDVFGNQMALLSSSSNLHWWCHETGSLQDLELLPFDWIALTSKYGLSWMSQYDDGSLDVAKEHGAIADTRHLHWIVPLALGGVPQRSNCTELDRLPHLVGHAALWHQIGHLPPGTAVMP